MALSARFSGFPQASNQEEIHRDPAFHLATSAIRSLKHLG